MPPKTVIVPPYRRPSLDADPQLVWMALNRRMAELGIERAIREALISLGWRPDVR